jgi:hypothetical protein
MSPTTHPRRIAAATLALVATGGFAAAHRSPAKPVR